MWPNLQFPADLVTFTKEILNGKLHLLCSVPPSKVWGTKKLFSKFKIYSLTGKNDFERSKSKSCIMCLTLSCLVVTKGHTRLNKLKLKDRSIKWSVYLKRYISFTQFFPKKLSKYKNCCDVQVLLNYRICIYQVTLSLARTRIFFQNYFNIFKLLITMLVICLICDIESAITFAILEQ